MEALILTNRQAAIFLGVNVSTLWRWVEAGEIPFVRINGVRRYDRRELERWLSSKKQYVKPIKGVALER